MEKELIFSNKNLDEYLTFKSLHHILRDECIVVNHKFTFLSDSHKLICYNENLNDFQFIKLAKDNLIEKKKQFLYSQSNPIFKNSYNNNNDEAFKNSENNTFNLNLNFDSYFTPKKLNNIEYKSKEIKSYSKLKKILYRLPGLFLDFPLNKFNIIYISKILITQEEKLIVNEDFLNFGMRFIYHFPCISTLKKAAYENLINNPFTYVVNTFSQECNNIFKDLEVDLNLEKFIIIYDEKRNIIYKGQELYNFELFDIIKEYSLNKNKPIYGFKNKNDESTGQIRNYNQIEIEDIPKYNSLRQIVDNINHNYFYQKGINISNEILKFNFYSKKTANQELCIKPTITYNQSAVNKDTTGKLLNEFQIKFSDFINIYLSRDYELENYLNNGIKYYANYFLQSNIPMTYLLKKSEVLGLTKFLVKYEISNFIPLEQVFSLEEYFGFSSYYINDFTIKNKGDAELKEKVYLKSNYKKIIDSYNVTEFKLNLKHSKFNKDFDGTNRNVNFVFHTDQNKWLFTLIINNYSTFYLDVFKIAFPQKLYFEKKNPDIEIKIIAIILSDHDSITKIENDTYLAKFVEFTKIESIYFCTNENYYDLFTYGNLDDFNFFITTPVSDFLKKKHDHKTQMINDYSKLTNTIVSNVFDLNDLNNNLEVVKRDFNSLRFCVSKKKYEELEKFMQKIAQMKFQDLSYTPTLAMQFESYSELKVNIQSKNFDYIDSLFYVVIIVKILKKDFKYIQPFIKKIEKMIFDDEDYSKLNPFKTEFNFLDYIYDVRDLEVGSNCSKCSVKLGFNIPHYYCSDCNIYFCVGCGEAYNLEEQDKIKKLPHEHYLIYINVENDSGMKNICVDKFSSNIFHEYIDYEVYDTCKWSCTACELISTTTLRYVCLSCRKGPFISSSDDSRWGFCEFCSSCFEQIKNGENKLKPDYAKNLDKEKHCCKTHVFLKVEYNSGCYAHF